MKELIIQKCKEIEKEKNIKIIYCVESGSRAWNLASQNSDYDVRFIYKNPLDEYLQINLPRDVINKHYNKHGKPMAAEGCYYDFLGFDIFKFVKMLSSSNPTVIEWLSSTIPYYGQKNKIFENYARNHFNQRSLYWHYKSMCRQNYLKYLKSGNEVTYKKYLYAMRGLVNCKWVVINNKVPPMNFLSILYFFHYTTKHKHIPEHITSILYDIINKKKQSKEKDIIKNSVKLDNYIETFLKEKDDEPKTKQIPVYNELNQELRRIINPSSLTPSSSLTKQAT